MSTLTLDQAQTIVTSALRYGRAENLQPLAVVVLDARGVMKASAAEDGTSLRREEIARGKAHGALSFGIGSRALAQARRRQPPVHRRRHPRGRRLPGPGARRRADPRRGPHHHRRRRHLRRQIGQRRGRRPRRHRRSRSRRRPGLRPEALRARAKGCLLRAPAPLVLAPIGTESTEGSGDSFPDLCPQDVDVPPVGRDGRPGYPPGVGSEGR